MKPKCQFVKPDKTECGGYAVKGDRFCYFHSEKYKEKRKLAVIEGGKSLKKNHGDIKPVKIRSGEDMMILLEKTINDLRQNKISSKTANTIGYLLIVQMKALEVNNSELRSKAMDSFMRGETNII